MKWTNVHIIGIGGISMSGIAKMLLNRETIVTGSDIKENAQIKELKKRGVKIYIGHQKSNIDNPQAVVYTNAINKDNIELQTARNKKIKIYKRAEFIAELFKNKKTIAITGTHGKTTTTSMLSSIFINAGRDPSVMIGGNLDILDGNIKDGTGSYFITEADESDGSLTFFDPKYAVITNIELDHFDYYKNEEELINKFKEFAQKIPDDGGLVIGSKALKNYPELKDLTKKYYKYGLTDQYFTAHQIDLKSFYSSFELFIKGEKIDTIKLKVPGLHNVLNALAAYTISYLVGLDSQNIKKGLSAYQGVKRRFEKKGTFKGALVIDDYAHHPTEIISTLQTAVRFKKRNLYIIFQPHRYSRTKNLLKEFSESFDRADELILTDIYAASEKPIREVSSEKLYKLIEKRKIKNNLNLKIKLISDFTKIKNYLTKQLREDDMLITMGAGDVYKIGEDILGDQDEK